MKPKLNRKKRLCYFLGSKIKNFIPVRWLVQLSGMYFILPFYHIVSDQKPAHVQHLYPIRTIKRFEEDLLFFLSHFEAVTPTKFLQRMRTTSDFQKPFFLISFDDGFSEVFRFAIPIMEKYGLKCICFINTNFIDNKSLFYRCKASLIGDHITHNTELSSIIPLDEIPSSDDILGITFSGRSRLDSIALKFNISFDEYLRTYQPYMTWDQLMDLQSEGHCIGAHSADHPHYSEISESERRDQTMTSVNTIVERLSPTFKMFSFPFTDHGIPVDHFKWLASAVDISFGTAGLKQDYAINHFQRIPMEVGNYDAASIIYGEYLMAVARRIFGKNKVQR